MLGGFDDHEATTVPLVDCMMLSTITFDDGLYLSAIVPIVILGICIAVTITITDALTVLPFPFDTNAVKLYFPGLRTLGDILKILLVNIEFNPAQANPNVGLIMEQDHE